MQILGFLQKQPRGKRLIHTPKTNTIVGLSGHNLDFRGKNPTQPVKEIAQMQSAQ